MSEELSETMGVESPVTDADIAAFKYDHPHLDSHAESTVATDGKGSYIVEQRVTFEIFAFNAEEIGDVIFDVRGIKDALAESKLVFKMFETPLNAPWVAHLRDKGGVEVERMKSLTDADLQRPAIAIFWPNGYTTVIDGNNRIVRRWDDGLRTVRMAVVPLSKEMLPFICGPGQEEMFMDRRSKDDPRGMTTLGMRRMTVQ